MKNRIRNLLIIASVALIAAIGWVAYARHVRIAKVIAFADTLSGDSEVFTVSSLPESLEPLEEKFGIYTFSNLYQVELHGVKVPPRLFDFFHNAVVVKLDDCEIATEDLNDLLQNSNELRNVRLTTESHKHTGPDDLRLPSTATTLYLAGDFVSDVVVANFPKFPGLENLWLLHGDQESLTDESCSRISTIQSLKQLHIGSTAITDAGLEKLSSLSQLDSLTLVKNPNLRLTSPNLLSGFTKLDTVWVSQCPITDDSAKCFSACKHIEFIGLLETPIANNFLHQLGEGAMPSLETLAIRSNDQITAAGIRALIEGSDKLTSIYLQDCALSGEDMSTLQSEYPHVEFEK